MVPAKRRNVQLTLEEVHELFDGWRKGKGGRESIPPALWEAAVVLSTTYSINKISKHLRLNYNDLKARAKGHRVVPVPDSSAFIEFAAISTVDYTIEMERPGERTRITGNCNVVELAREFWRR